MAKPEHDIFASLAADIGSPEIVARIDRALEDLEHQRTELMELRKMAVRRHGESRRAEDEAPPKSAEAPSPSKQVQSMASLIASYKADPDSPFAKVRFRTRESYDSLLRRIDTDHGPDLIKDINARTILEWHQSWMAEGRVAMAHALVGMVRMLFSYGASILEDAECQRLCGVLNKMRFKMSKPRTEQLTREHADAIRTQANKMRLYSIALAQAIQFEGKLGQKDVIGEWVPLSVLNESREHAYIEGDSAWMYGIVWEEVDNDLVLRHTTSREGRLVTVNLRDAEMVMEEFRRMARKMLVSREDFPPDGPVIVSEKTGRPYRAHHFRDTWRKLAGMAGLPKTVKNMDSRPKRGGGQDVDADIATELNQ